MRARDVMTTDVLTVTPETSIVDAAKLMLDNHISGVPVVDQFGQLAGILTEGDLMRRAELETGKRPWWLALTSSSENRAAAYVKAHGLKARDVMTKNVVTIDEHETLDRIAMVFEEYGIKRAPIVREDKIIGIVSRANLLQGLAARKVADIGPSDRQIRSAILAAAQEEAGVRAPLVDITVSDGIVHLWGNVGSESERDAIRVVAENTGGVREVRSHLRVLSPSGVEWKPE